MSGLMKWPGSRSRRKAPREWLKHVPDAELEVLMALVDLGSLPSDTALLYQETQARAETKMNTTLMLPAPDDVTVPADASFAEWLRFKWRSADTSVRHTLRTVAEALGVSVPLSRTRNSSVGVPDSSPARRTESGQHPNHGESEPAEVPAEADPEDHCDGPQWSDDDALVWEPCESLHDAFRSDVDWY